MPTTTERIVERATAIGKEIVESSGGKNKTDGTPIARTLVIIGSVLASCFTFMGMQLYSSQQIMQIIVKQNHDDTMSIRDSMKSLGDKFDVFSATIRTLVLVQGGADPPANIASQPAATPKRLVSSKGRSP